MRRSLILCAALATLALIPDQVLAQRSGRGTVNTPFGQFNMNDMRSAGGNPYAAEELREQKQMMLYQQQMMKQQQQLMAKQQKTRQDYLRQHPEAAKSGAGGATTAASSTPPARSLATGKAQSKTSKAKNATADLNKSGTSKKTAPTTKVPGAPDN